MAKTSERYLARQKEPKVPVRVSVSHARMEGEQWKCYATLSFFKDTYDQEKFQAILTPEECERMAAQLLKMAAKVRSMDNHA